MQTEAAAPARRVARATETAPAISERLRQTRLFCEYRRAFEGATGLGLAIDPARSQETDQHAEPYTVRRIDRAGVPCKKASLMTYVPVIHGQQVAAWLVLGPFSWRESAQMESVNRSTPHAGGRAIDRREHRSLLRLVAVFALQLAEASEGLLVENASAEPPFVTAARAYIAAHLTENIALTAVAEAVHISPYYFCKRFRESTGLHFTEYVSRSRVARVKDRLLNPHVHVSEAAYEAGFQSLSQFNRAFRRVVGEAPSDFRLRVQTRLRALRDTHAA